MKRIEALRATQHLPVHRVRRDFGVRRSSDGLVLLSRSVAPGAKAGDVLRLMASDRIDLCWRVLRGEGRDYVLDWFDDSMRLRVAMIAKSFGRGAPGRCAGRGASSRQPQGRRRLWSSRLVWFTSAIHL